MHRTDGADATAQSRFTDGNPNTGTPATVIEQNWLNAVQEELCNVVEGAGLTLVKGTWTQTKTALNNWYGKPIMSLEEFMPWLPNFPGLPPNYVWCEGQLISDAASPLNGFRVPNLNGATVSGITVSTIDNVNKTIAIGAAHINAPQIGDSITLAGTSLLRGVVRSIDYVNNLVEIGDANLWSGAQFGLTTQSIAGATSVTFVGLNRFLRGATARGSDVDEFQGHRFNAGLAVSDSSVSIYGVDTSVTNATRTSNVSETKSPPFTSLPLSDGTNGTPRTGSRTQPAYVSTRIAIRIK